MHLLSYVVKCTVTDSPFSTQANCSKCPLSAWMHFLTCVTTELVTLQSTAVLMLLAALRIRWSKLFSRVHLVCIHHDLSCSPTHCNLMGSDPMTVVANSLHHHDQSINLGIHNSDTALQETSIYGIVIILTNCRKQLPTSLFCKRVVWWGVVGDQLIGPYIFSQLLTRDF